MTLDWHEFSLMRLPPSPPPATPGPWPKTWSTSGSGRPKSNLERRRDGNRAIFCLCADAREDRAKPLPHQSRKAKGVLCELRARAKGGRGRGGTAALVRTAGVREIRAATAPWAPRNVETGNSCDAPGRHPSHRRSIGPCEDAPYLLPVPWPSVPGGSCGLLVESGGDPCNRNSLAS